MPRYKVTAVVAGDAVYYVDAHSPTQAAEWVIEGEVSPYSDRSYLTGETKVELAEDEEGW